MIKKITRRKLYREWVILAALSLLVILLRWPSLEQPFDNDSGANAYHARLIARGEPLYSTHHPAHQLPGVYYTYALAFTLFGDSVWAVKFLLILWTIAAVCLLYRLGTLLMSKTAASLAAVFYAVLSSHIWLFGSTAQAELFANLPRIAAILIMLHLTKRNAAAWQFALVGLLSAAAFMFRAVYLSSLAVAGFVLLTELCRRPKMPGVWRTVITRGLWISLGFTSGLLAVGVYFAALGLLPRLLLVFTLGQRYIASEDVVRATGKYWLFFPFIGLLRNNVVLLVCSLGGLAAALLSGFQSRRTRKTARIFSIAVWYVLSFIESNVGCNLFLHYYLLIVPPLSLLAAWFLAWFYHYLNKHIPTISHALAALLPGALLIAALIVSIEQNFDYYRLYTQYKFGLGNRRDFALHGWPLIEPQIVPAQELADYIQRHSLPSDYVYYWSDNIQFYYMADRRCPIDTIWPLYVAATGSHQRIFAPQTKYIIIGESNQAPYPTWLHPELAERGYRLETTIEDQEVYRRPAD